MRLEWGMLVEGRRGPASSPPEHPTLIYDDECSFCRRWVARAMVLDPDCRVALLPRAAQKASTLSGQSPECLRRALHLVRPDGEVFAGAAAVRELFRYLRWGWVYRAATSLPGLQTLSATVYRWVAHRWGPVSD